MKAKGIIKPQPGKQSEFMANQSDVCWYGGSAGSGKSVALLLEAMRYVHVPGYTAVIFRKTSPMLMAPGAIWSQSREIYPQVGGVGFKQQMRWEFPSGAQIKFSHMESEEHRYDWQGSAITYCAFDELTHFSEESFFYLMSRLRTSTHLRPYMRASLNPSSTSWVRRFIDWWIGDDGYAIQERSGKIRYFARDGDEIHWADTEAELKKRLGPDCEPKSFSFIAATLKDNPILTANNPGYVASLKALPKIERMQLLDGNWNCSASSGLFFKKSWFEIVGAAPAEGTVCRYWDRAGTEGKGDYTVGLKMRRANNGVFYVEDVVRLQGSPLTVEQAIINTASRDGVSVAICLEQDPGQAGKADVGNLIRRLVGFNARAIPVSKDKATRAKPASAQAEAGNIKVVRAGWNEPLLTELENFTEDDSHDHDDQVDALSGAFNYLAQVRKVFFACGGSDDDPPMRSQGFRAISSLSEIMDR